MPPTRPLHACFRDAYCDHHGCGSAGFERHLLLRIIPWQFRPLAVVSLWLDSAIFASELEVIRNAGPARSGREVNAAAQDLVHLGFVEHSFRRTIGMRGRSEAVIAAWDEVKARVDRPAMPDHPSVGFSQTASRVRAAPRAAALGRKDSALALRFLQSTQTLLSGGKALGPILEAAAMTPNQLLEILDAHPREASRLQELREEVLRHRDRSHAPDTATAIPRNAPARTTSQTLS